MCALFTLPHPEHLFNSVTSFKCFPEANCRCLFFMCEVFFFGTALNIDSHMSLRIEESPAIAATGIGRVIEGKGEF